MSRVFRVSDKVVKPKVQFDWDAYINRFKPQQAHTDHIIEVRYVKNGKVLSSRKVNMNVKFPLKNWEV